MAAVRRKPKITQVLKYRDVKLLFCVTLLAAAYLLMRDHMPISPFYPTRQQRRYLMPAWDPAIEVEGDNSTVVEAAGQEVAPPAMQEYGAYTRRRADVRKRTREFCPLDLSKASALTPHACCP